MLIALPMQIRFDLANVGRLTNIDSLRFDLRFDLCLGKS